MIALRCSTYILLGGWCFREGSLEAAVSRAAARTKGYKSYKKGVRGQDVPSLLKEGEDSGERD